MKLCLVVGLLGLLAAACLVAAEEEREADKLATVGKEKLPMPKMFVFANYKNIFKKHYSSFLEELARQKIYLARAFRAFISLVDYKHYKRSYFLKINDMSDWTETEIGSMYKRQPFGEAMGRVHMVEPPRRDLKDTPVASLEDVKAKLDEIVDNPEYKKVADELRVQRVKRHAETGEKRSRRKGSKRASLSLNDLVAKPVEHNEVYERVPSSNPYYEPPELTSHGVDDNSGNSMHNDNDYSLISSLPGSSYINSIISTIESIIDDVLDDEEDDDGDDEYDDADSSEEIDKADTLLIDHRRSGCLPRPKSQGKCGSCYIFSTTALYEWRYCTETGHKAMFSEQYPLDCGERIGMRGCMGGDERKVAIFYGTYGIELSKNYPYRARNETCPYDPEATFMQMGYLKLYNSHGSMVGIKFENVPYFLEHAPVLMGINVPNDFPHYGGGIVAGDNCVRENSHAMLLIGVGKENGVEYWLFRNSHGDYWGEDGHYRLDKRALPNCYWNGGLSFFLYAGEGGRVFMESPNEFHSVIRRQPSITKQAQAS